MAVLCPDDRETVEEMLRHQMRGKIGSCDFRIILSDGSIRWIRNRYFPVMDGQNRFQQVAGLAENITEFKTAEQILLRSQEELEHLVQERTGELIKANAALQEKEEHFRQLFATIPMPVFLCSESTKKFLEVNHATTELYGYSRDEFLQMTMEDIRPPEEIPFLRKSLKQIGSAPLLLQAVKHRTKDGTVINVEVTVLRVHFTGVPSLLIAIQDVTERLRMEVELRHGQKLQAVGELAAGIAHEINTPIQFVGNNAEFLQSAIPSLLGLVEKLQEAYGCAQSQCSPQLTEQIKRAHEAADLNFLRSEIPRALAETMDGVGRVSSIVQALKKFSHVEWGAEKTPADLNDSLASTLSVARNELKYVADVETAFGDLPPVPCHLGDLNQVFLNLLVNAAHAIGDVVGKTGGRGRIRVQTSTENEWAVIAISDTGTGIPVEIRSRIFDPFFTTKGVGKGTGQGLALARAIVVEKHQGTLTFDTALGRGTTFYIRIPLVDPATDEQDDAEQKTAPS